MDDVQHAASRSLSIGALTIDPGRLVVRHADGTDQPLRAKSMDVLLRLARTPRAVVTRAALMEEVWPDLFVTDDSLTQCIVEIRRALGDQATALRTVPRRGYLLDCETVAPPPVAPAAGPPVVAVLPFDNLSRDARWDRLCDGLVEDIITDLARQPDLRVIARTSSFAWRGRPADIREIGGALGARYVLEGSVQAEGRRVDVTAQLIDAETGAHLWAERLSRSEAGIFAIQEEVVARIAGSIGGLAGSIARAERARLHRRRPANLAAYENYLLGYEAEARLDRAGMTAAVPFLEAAVAADPTLARAWTVLGFALGNMAANGWTEDVAATRARQRVAIAHALDLDPDDGLALEEAGAVAARAGDLAAARDLFGRAAVAGARHADTLALLAKYQAEVLGEATIAQRMTARAAALNPFAPAWYLLGATRVAYFSGDFAQAAALARRAPPLRLPRLIGVLALAQMEDAPAAQAALAVHRRDFGADGWRHAVDNLPPLCAEAARLLQEGLDRAGLR
jgi:TolB-like protein/DNA-binding winged helix-turn-helix (wHTH) protein